MFILAHLSDLHVTQLGGAPPLALLNKRFFGWLSWTLRRARAHRPEVVEALIDDLEGQAPDHIAVTGDLTNVALEQEFRAAERWLARIGNPERVSLVPGNHDAYVRIEAARSWNRWVDFMGSDSAPAETRHATSPAIDSLPASAIEFPTLRIRGPVALVGLCSALPTALFRATGRLGPGQITRLGRMLEELRARDLFRIVLIHHPPTDRDVAPRRRLVDSAALREVFRKAGAELVLHGHVHRTRWSEIQGPDGVIPVAGVRSASDIGEKEDKRAQYHLYRIERGGRPGNGPGARIHVSIRGYQRAGRRFVAEAERWL